MFSHAGLLTGFSLGFSHASHHTVFSHAGLRAVFSHAGLRTGFSHADLTEALVMVASALF